MSDLLHNYILWSALSAWIVAQLIKGIIYTIKNRTLNLGIFISTGGMPSAHAAGVSAAVVSIGQVEGWDSPVTSLAIVFAIITILDAVGVRQAAGHHARILNKILQDWQKEGRIYPHYLKELLGHTFFEVLVGVLLGISMSFLWI